MDRIASSPARRSSHSAPSEWRMRPGSLGWPAAAGEARLARTPMAGHCFPAVVALGQVSIVAATHEPDVLHAVVTAKAEWVPMVKLELVARLTPSAVLVHVAASAAVAFKDGSSHGRGDVAGVWRWGA